MHSKFEVIFWNIAGIANMEGDLIEGINSYSILCLYETWVDDVTMNLPRHLATRGFTFVNSPAVRTASRGRAKGGIICVINKNIYNFSTVYMSKFFLFIRISNINVIIGIVYVSPLEILNGVLEEVGSIINELQSTFMDHKILVGGDFNARIGEKNCELDGFFSKIHLCMKEGKVWIRKLMVGEEACLNA